MNIFLIQNNSLWGQEKTLKPLYDTIHITMDSMIVFRDSILVPLADTTIIIDSGIHYKIKKNRYKRSKAFYDSVYYKTHKKKISRELYSLVLSHKPQEKIAPGEHMIALNPFEAYGGKVIKSIRFVQVDILDGSVEDTLQYSKSGFSKFLNKTHVNTHDWVIKRYMLVKTGDSIIPAILADNERVIRELGYIEDARFWIEPDPFNANEVDLIVVTKDIFPIGATASFSSFKNYSASLWDGNIGGLGYELGGKLIYNADFDNPWGYNLYTKYSNLWGSFIDGGISWYDAFDAQWLKIDLSKDFLTPQTKFGGGLNIGWIRDHYEIYNADTSLSGMFKTNYQNIWLGRSFLMGDKKSRNNIIVSIRYEREKFELRPYIDADSNISFHNKNIYYAKIGYSKINFYKANMIRAYGVPEDIPYGINTGLTVAYLDSDFIDRLYLGFSIGAGKYFTRFGYIAGNLILGGFYRNGKPSQGIIESNLLYYTPLIKANRYSMRHFLRIRYREAVTRDAGIRINFGADIREIDQDRIQGASTMIFKYEFALFSPWYFYGFRFAPYCFADLGLISINRNIMDNSRLYSAVGIGFRIRNESLAFKTIILSFGYIPSTRDYQGEFFYQYYMGIDPLVPVLGNDRPYILRRDLIFPY